VVKQEEPPEEDPSSEPILRISTITKPVVDLLESVQPAKISSPKKKPRLYKGKSTISKSKSRDLKKNMQIVADFKEKIDTFKNRQIKSLPKINLCP
jgi:hypothetical protein